MLRYEAALLIVSNQCFLGVTVNLMAPGCLTSTTNGQEVAKGLMVSLSLNLSREGESLVLNRGASSTKVELNRDTNNNGGANKEQW